MPLNRFYLDGKRIRSQMPDVSTKKKRPGRPRQFDKQAYDRVRSMIERFNGWIKAFRRVATRYERLPQVYMGFVFRHSGKPKPNEPCFRVAQTKTKPHYGNTRSLSKAPDPCRLCYLHTFE